ncbi:hypothetical protein COT07_01960 [Candidatus Woesearchaeota archaeon CG07_land_8_20_14_0_80_44_23]|nr:MAG: hypothetical protein COT07_01960 [Candidatus Woesearchaeota archaeon CG07_land_8_20_14_0_80_44_23]
MNKSRKGDISIGLIFSIIVTVIGIMLLLILAAKTSDGKKFYCELSSKYAPNFYATRMDSFCYGVSQNELSPIKGEDVVSGRFSDGSEIKTFGFTQQKLSREFSVTIDRDAILKNASLLISAPNNRLINAFSSGENNITLPPYPLHGGSQYAYLKIPKYAIIKNASVKVYGSNYPTKTDIAFAIDTSASMTNEWNSVCSIVSNVSTYLRILNVQKYRIRVYRIGATGTIHETCDSPAKNLVISAANLSTTGLPLYQNHFIQQQDNLCCWNLEELSKADDYNEAWGVASYYLSGAVGEDAWLDESKKIEILISDSDPTGAVPTQQCLRPSPPCTQSSTRVEQTEPVFSGSEEEVINQAASRAVENNVFVNVVYGDDSPPPEGFGIGCPSLGGCCSGSLSSCYQIIIWMNTLATQTGGKVFGFKDSAGLMAAVKDMVISNYPNQIKLSVSGAEFASHPEELNSANSPWKASGHFADALQDALSECAPDDEGNCIIALEVSSGRDGTIILNHLRITYDIRAQGASLSLKGKQILPQTTLNAESRQVDFTDAARELEKQCSTDYCTYQFRISASSPTQLVAEGLSLNYKKYPIKEDIANAIAECWAKARFGQAKSDFFCQELSIPEEYQFIRAITEADIANVLKARQWCHIIADSDYGCGDSDSIKFAKDINTRTNVLIEYKAKEKAVLVT